MAKVSKKILSVNAIIVWLVMLKCSAISGRPGAIIELANGVTKVYKDTCHRESEC